MKAYLTRRYMLSASHRLHCDSMSAEENRATYGKCNNPHGHGHNYYVEVSVSGHVDPATGMICNLVDLDSYIREHVLERFDHQNLNHLDEFRGIVPSSENLCELVYNIVKQGFSAAHLDKVRLEETTMNSVEFAGGAEPLR
ncbi:MAG TPA: 6-carboxytetrahydropterin synthase [Clostridia bacterium]|nr:6-carboxytetrahydropterin synthase [Clostridia bacterium]